MATMQIQKTVAAETITKTAIDQKQSLEVVQTMLHGGLSSLSYIRDFFPDKAFDKQLYETADKIHPYEDYAAGKLAKDDDTSNTPSTRMRVLRRGRSKRADMFLDWLENAAFEALKAGHLQALQVYVHETPNDREKVIETYTFTIKYMQDAANGQTLAGLEMDGPGSPIVSVHATNESLQFLLRQIGKVCGNLPDLPEQRYISMELFYLPGCETKYKPEGFIPGKGNTLVFAAAEGWEKQTAPFELSSLFHKTMLEVSSLVQTSTEHGSLEFPQALHYKTKGSKLREIQESESGPKTVEQAAEVPSPGSAVASTTPSTIVEAPYQHHAVSKVTRGNEKNGRLIMPTPTSDHVVAPRQASLACTKEPSQSTVARAVTATAFASQLDSSLDTQSSNIVGMRSAFQEMMQPEDITQGDTQTQSLPHRPPPAETESTVSSSRLTVSPTKSIMMDPPSNDKPTLSPSKVDELSRKKQVLHRQAFDVAKRAGRKNLKGDVVLCQCGHTKEEDDMVQCSFCETWQHLPCYGYADANDPRLPEDHTCYRCLLGDEEKLTLRKVEDLALKRRAIDFALQHGLRTQKEFADDLDLDNSVAQQLYGYLKSAGFVVPASGAHKAGYKATGKPLFVAIREGPKHKLMMEMLFDPFMHIAHHYDIPHRPITQLPSLTKRLLASQAKEMPPPATPASQMRKRNAATPASGLDLRASMTPFQTPSRPRGRAPQPQKRLLDEESTKASPPKRQATPSSVYRRMRSMQSRYMIDANGLSSSPAGTPALR